MPKTLLSWGSIDAPQARRPRSCPGPARTSDTDTVSIEREKISGWHFVGGTYPNGRSVPADGEVLSVQGFTLLSRSVLSVSERVIDALNNASGSTICRVEVWGNISHRNDKFVGRHRRILWRIDGAQLLRQLAREQALSVAHLWSCPEIVREYLETGQERMRSAAYKTAKAAARNAPSATMWDTAKAATWATDRGAENTAARNTVKYAANALAWNAASNAMSATARKSAWDDTWNATCSAARNRANTRLTELVEAEHARVTRGAV